MSPNASDVEMVSYYLAGQKVSYRDIEKYIQNNSYIQKTIKNQHSRAVFVFLRESKCTDKVLKYKSIKSVLLCNDDIIVEYSWIKGNPADTFYFKNGVIIGADEIELK